MAGAFRCDVCHCFQDGIPTDEIREGVAVRGADIGIQVIFQRDGESTISRSATRIEACDFCKVEALRYLVKKLEAANEKMVRKCT